jgi:hypothetical protein
VLLQAAEGTLDEPDDDHLGTDHGSQHGR